MLGSAAFDSLTELVQYYEMKPVFRGKSLRYPVNSKVFSSRDWERSAKKMIIKQRILLLVYALLLCVLHV